MASTENQTDIADAREGTPQAPAEASPTTKAPARTRRSRASAAAPAEGPTAGLAAADTPVGSTSLEPASAGGQTPTDPVRKTPSRRTRKVAAPAQAPQADEVLPLDPMGGAADVEPKPVEAQSPAPRKRAARRVTASTATPEESAQASAEAPAAEAAETRVTAPAEASSEATVNPSESSAGRAPRKRATRKTTAAAAAVVVAPTPVEPVADDLPDAGIDEDSPTEATQESEASDPAYQASVVPSFGLLFQAPVVVPTRRRATRPSGTPILPPAGHEDPGPEEATDQPSDDVEDLEDVHDVEGVEGDTDGTLDALDQGEDATSPAARRRRRRGGKGRRGRVIDGPAGASASGPGASGGVPADAADTDSEAADAADEGGEDDSDSGAETRTDVASRRRTRRRRRGSSTGEVEDAPGVVTRVREVRATRDEVVGVRGSTRLEAKKQRRREGREAGRRRQVITEAEFLARRESVERVMVVRAKEGRTQIGVLEDGVLVEHYVSRETNASMAGNIYLGKVQNVLPSMEAAFVDIGRGRNAVLYAGEVNWDAAGMEAGASKRIENALESGQSVLVQVTKDPIGHKGARLTSQVSLPGRYLVYVPDSSMTGISRKLPDTERARLKRILRDVVPETAGVIVRTAAEGASEEELRADVERLTAIWEQIKAKAEAAGGGKKGKGNAPVLLHGEPDLTVRVIRDVFNEDFAQMVVAGDAAWAQINDYVGSVAPDLAPRLTKWTGEKDVFSQHRIDEQLAKAMDRKVWLPSGGSLVIDRTEAMTVVDVNTGKFVGAGGNLEETVTRNNIEAAEEIVRQLRLRDIGGIIVIDFIDMVLESNRDLVVRRLLECLGRDRTKHQVAEVTSLGLVQMTRKRVGSGLIEVFSQPCEHCNGRGYIVQSEPVERAGSPVAEPEPTSPVGGGAPRSRSRRGRSGMPSEQSQPQVATLPTPAPGGPTPAQIAAAAHAAALKSTVGPGAEDSDASPEAADGLVDGDLSVTSDAADGDLEGLGTSSAAPAPVEVDAMVEVDAIVVGVESGADAGGAAADVADVVDAPGATDEPTGGDIDGADGDGADGDASDTEGADTDALDTDASDTDSADEAGDDAAENDSDDPGAGAPAAAAAGGGRSAYQGSRRGSRGRRRGRGRASAPAGPPRPDQDG